MRLSKKLIAVPALVLTAGLSLAACGSQSAPAAAPAVTHTVTAAPAPTTPAPTTAAPAPVVVVPAPAPVVVQPAPVYVAPAVPAGFRAVSTGVYANGDTSNALAQNIVTAYNGPGSDSEYVYSPVTDQSYLMTYTQSGNWVTATGGVNVAVQFNY